MGFLSKLFGISGVAGEAAGKAVATAAAPVIDSVGAALDRLFTSDDEKAKAAFVIEQLRMHPQELQVELNKIEAGSTSWWVAGWRPYIGWVCGTSLAIYYIPQFAMASIIWAAACWSTGSIQPYPVSQISGLLELLGAMLGIAGMRTYEKVQGVGK